MAERIVVVGGGSMGAGIAAVAAAGGYDVAIVEPDDAARERATARAPHAAILSSVPEDSAVRLAIEAVPERLDLKRAMFETLAQRLPGAVLATNTSSLSVAEIGVAAPERTVGLHFFNPPEKMQLVEVVRTDRSADAAVRAARVFVERIGRTAIVTADTPGFVVNRVARPFYLQALRALEADVASIERLDALARGIGFRMGPFELMDFIGLDVNLATSESVYERTGEERFEPRPLQRELVARGRLGAKSGAGFYEYAQRPGRLDLRCDARAARFERPVCSIAQEPLASALTELGARTDGDAEVVLVDAYGVDVARARREAKHPENLVGIGVVGSLAQQSGIEVVENDATSPRAVSLVEELFAGVGHGAVRVRDVPGLFLGRIVASIIEEARLVVSEGVASAQDVDRAMRLGANYPHGPIEWGREIGDRRIAGILDSLERITDT